GASAERRGARRPARWQWRSAPTPGTPARNTLHSRRPYASPPAGSPVLARLTLRDQTRAVISQLLERFQQKWLPLLRFGNATSKIPCVSGGFNPLCQNGFQVGSRVKLR